VVVVYVVVVCLEVVHIVDAYVQGDHFSGKPGKHGNVRELYRCQGNVRDFTKSQGNVREKILSWKIVAVDVTGFYDVIIMKSLSLNMNLTV